MNPITFDYLMTIRKRNTHKRSILIRLLLLLLIIVIALSNTAHAKDPADEEADMIEEAIEESIEASEELEEQIEEIIEASIEEAEELEEMIEEAIEDSIKEAEDFEKEMEEALEDSLEELEELQEEIQESYEDDIKENRRSGSSGDYDDDDDNKSDRDDKSGRKKNKDDRNKDDRRNSNSSGKSNKSNQQRSSLPALELAKDKFGHEFVKGPKLAAIFSSEVPKLRKEGFIIRKIEKFDALDIVLVETSKNPNKPDMDSRQEPASALENKIDYNHIFYSEASVSTGSDLGDAPTKLFKMPDSSASVIPKIGVIDTDIDISHVAIKDIQLKAKSFSSSEQLSQPKSHGTAIVSILAGSSTDYNGLLPKSNIYLASVFYEDDQHQAKSTTLSLVRALNWMVENKVPIVNMSLTGPENKVLKEAIKQAKLKGTTIVSAVGNAGPNSPALYPAAYNEVVAVTAVSKTKKVYRLANTGSHVDFAAPGVNVQHAGINQMLESSSGTSMAAPFVSAALAMSCSKSEQNCDIDRILQEYTETAIDLGTSGFDPIYGNGLISP